MDDDYKQAKHRNRSPVWRAAVEAVAANLLEGREPGHEKLASDLPENILRVAAANLLIADARDLVRRQTSDVERASARHDTVVALDERDVTVAQRVADATDAEVDSIHLAIECPYTSHSRAQVKRRVCVSRILALPVGDRSRAIELERNANRDAVAEERVRRERYITRLGGLIEDWGKELRMQWTKDLLATKVARRDGSYTTWGEATVAEHEERLAMFTDQAGAALDGASRHRQAIDALRVSGCSTLNELMER